MTEKELEEMRKRAKAKAQNNQTAAATQTGSKAAMSDRELEEMRKRAQAKATGTTTQPAANTASKPAAQTQAKPSPAEAYKQTKQTDSHQASWDARQSAKKKEQEYTELREEKAAIERRRINESAKQSAAEAYKQQKQTDSHQRDWDRRQEKAQQKSLEDPRKEHIAVRQKRTRDEHRNPYAYAQPTTSADAEKAISKINQKIETLRAPGQRSTQEGKDAYNQARSELSRMVRIRDTLKQREEDQALWNATQLMTEEEFNQRRKTPKQEQQMQEQPQIGFDSTDYLMLNDRDRALMEQRKQETENKIAQQAAADPTAGDVTIHGERFKTYQEYVERMQPRVQGNVYKQEYAGLDASAVAALEEYNQYQNTAEAAKVQYSQGIGAPGTALAKQSVMQEWQSSNHQAEQLRQQLMKQYGWSDAQFAAYAQLQGAADNAQTQAAQFAELAQATKDHQIIASVASVPASAYGGLVGMQTMGKQSVQNWSNRRQGFELDADPNDPGFMLSRGANTIRSTVEDEHDWVIPENVPLVGGKDAFDFLYSTGMSAADSAAASLIPGGEVMLGAGAASQAYTDALERGVDQKDAMKTGIAAGVFETAFEHVSISQLDDFKEVAPNTWKDVIKNIGKGTATNFSEESLTEVADILSDYWINGGQSEYEQNVQAYRLSGMTEEEARKQARKDAAIQVAEAGASGALMGAGFGLGGSTVGKVRNNAETNIIRNEIGSAAADEGMRGVVLKGALAAPEGSKARTTAEKYKEKTQKKERLLTDKEVGKLYMETQEYLEQTTPKGSQAGVTTVKEARQRYAEQSAQLNDSDLTPKEIQQARKELAEERDDAIAKIERGDAQKAKSIADVYKAAEQNRQAQAKQGRTLGEMDKLKITNPELTVDGKQTAVDGGNLDVKNQKYTAFNGILEPENGAKDTSSGAARHLPLKGKAESAAELKVKLSDGRTVTMQKVIDSLEQGSLTRAVWERAAQLGNAEAANLFIDHFDGENTVDLDDYRKAVQDLRGLGSTGLPFAQLQDITMNSRSVLTKEAQEAFFNEAARNHKVTPGLTDLSTPKNGSARKISNAVVEAVGKFGTLEFVTVDDYKGVNGEYLRGRGVIVLSRNAEGGLIGRTVGHEVYHYLQEYAGDNAQALENFVLQKLGGRDSKAVGKMLEKYDSEIYKTQQAKIDELVADSMFEVFNNEDVIRELTGRHAKLSEKLSRRLGQMVQVVNKTLRAMGALKRDDGTALKPEIAALIDDAEALAEIRRMMLEGLKKAGENRAAGMAAGEQAEKNTAGAVDSFIDAEAFGQQLQDWIDGQGKAYKSYNGKYFNLGTTPSILIKHGAKKLKFIMLENVITKETGEKHNIALEELARMPEELNDPILLIKGNKPNHFIALTGIKDKSGYDVIAIINADGRYRRAKVTKLLSAYSKTDRYEDNIILDFVDKQIEAGNLLDASETKAPTWFTNQGRDLPKLVQTIIDANNSIAQINTKSQGPKSTKDADYLAAVEKGDTETAQKMVDAAAKEYHVLLNADGTPRQFYHGTRNQFYTFDKKRIGENYGGYNAAGGAFDFTDSKRFAELLGAKAKGTAPIRVIPVYLKAEKTFYSYYGAVDPALASELPATLTQKEREAAMKNGAEYHRILKKHGIDFAATIQKYGYDSYAQYPSDPNMSVYSQEQIKSSEPVTYDDDGNVIPLSERFDQSKEDFRYSKQDITMDMDDEKRAEILRHTVIHVVDKSNAADVSLNYDHLKKMTLNGVNEYLHLIFDDHLIRSYQLDKLMQDAEVEFRFSKGGFDESIHKQTHHRRVLSDLALALKYMPEIIEGAEIVGIFSDKYKGTRREDPSLDAMYVLLGGLEAKQAIIPVEFEIKIFNNGQKNKLHVVATLDRFDKTKIKASKVGPPEIKKRSHENPALTFTPYMLTDIAQNVNLNNGNFLKRLPGQILTAEQNTKRNAIIQTEYIKLRDKRYEYAVKKDPKRALEMLAEKRAQSNLPEGVVKLDEITFDDNGKLIPLSKRYDASNPDERYSTKDDINSYYAEALRENRNFRQIYAALGDAYTSRLGDTVLDSRQIDQIAGKILRQTGSGYDRGKLNDQLTILYDFVANNPAESYDADEMHGIFANVAKQILNESKAKDTELFDQYKDVRDYLRNVKVYINPTVKAEIENSFGDYNTFKRALTGKMMRMSTTEREGRMSLDQLWQELNEMAPAYFPADTNEGDMPEKLTYFFEATAPQIVNPYEHYGASIDEEAAILGAELEAEYFNIQQIQTPQKRGANVAFEALQEIGRAKKAMRQELRARAKLTEQEQFRAYQDRLHNYKQARADADRRRIDRNATERDVNYLRRRLNRETNTDHIPEGMKELVRAWTEVIPGGKGSFTLARWDSFERVYRRYIDEHEHLQAGTHEDIGSYMLSEIDALRRRTTGGERYDGRIAPGARLQDLDSIDTQRLRDLAAHMKHLVQTENRAFDARNRERISTLGQRTHGELAGKESRHQGLHVKSKLNERAGAYFNSLALGLAKPEYLFSNLGSETLYEMYKNIRRGENTEAKILQAAKDREQAIKAEHHYDERWVKQEVTLHARQGDVKLTVEDAMSLWATAQRAQGRKHLLSGGATIYTEKEVLKNTRTDMKNERRAEKGKEAKTRITNKTILLTEADLDTLGRLLTNDQKGYVNAMVDYITHDIGAQRNEISMALYGIERYKEKYYYPITVDRNTTDRPLGRIEQPSTIKNQGSSKRVQDVVTNPAQISGFTQTVNRHIYDSALYCAYTLALEDFKRVYNYRENDLGDYETEGAASLVPRGFTVQGDVEKAAGVNTKRQVEDFLTAADSGVRGNVMSLQGAFMSKAKKAAVMGNLSVIVQQPTAVFRAMLYIDPKYFPPVGTKADIEEMRKYNGCVLKKDIGYFDVNMGRTVADWLNDYKSDKDVRDDWSFGDKAANAWGKAGKTMDDVMGWGASKADELTWGGIWHACKKQVAAEQGLTGEAQLEAAAELFQDVISKTQVYDSVFTKCDFMRRKEGFAMMTMQFMAEPVTSLNMLVDAVKNNKSQHHAARAIAFYMVSLVVNNAMKSLVYAARDDDEDKSFWEKYLASLAEGMPDDIVGMIPYLKDVISVLKGYDLKRLDATFIETCVQAYKSLQNDNKSALQKTQDILKAIGQTTGVPFYNVWRDSKAIYNSGKALYDRIVNKDYVPTTGKGIVNALKESYSWAGANPDTDAKLLMLDYLDGDEKDFARREKSIDAMANPKTAMTNAIKALYLDDRIDDDQAMRLMLEVRGNTEKDAKTNLDKWKKAKLPDAQDDQEADGAQEESGTGSGGGTAQTQALQDAIRNNDAAGMQQEYQALVEEKGDQKAGQAMTKQIKAAYADGSISYETADRLIRTYQPEKDKDDVYDLLEEAVGRDKYTAFNDAITSGKNLDKTIEKYRDLGIKDSTLKSQVTRTLKPKVLSGEIDEERAIDAFMALGDSYGEAAKKIKDWYE
ncbi:MAG: hypothetical protein IK080_01865 [Clostridia bacterium]|nr:hypothetical protein [Clostridia bacterium]